MDGHNAAIVGFVIQWLSLKHKPLPIRPANPCGEKFRLPSHAGSSANFTSPRAVSAETEMDFFSNKNLLVI